MRYSVVVLSLALTAQSARPSLAQRADEVLREVGMRICDGCNELELAIELPADLRSLLLELFSKSQMVNNISITDRGASQAITSSTGAEQMAPAALQEQYPSSMISYRQPFGALSFADPRQGPGLYQIPQLAPIALSANIGAPTYLQAPLPAVAAAQPTYSMLPQQPVLPNPQVQYVQPVSQPSFTTQPQLIPQAMSMPQQLFSGPIPGSVSMVPSSMASGVMTAPVMVESVQAPAAPFGFPSVAGAVGGPTMLDGGQTSQLYALVSSLLNQSFNQIYSA